MLVVTMLNYLNDMKYALKYDDVIKNTKRAIAKKRKEQRDLSLRASKCRWAPGVGVQDRAHHEARSELFSCRRGGASSTCCTPQ